MLPPSFIVNNYNDNLPDFVCDKCSAKVPQITIMNTLTQLVKERDSTLKADESSDVSQFIKTLEKQRKILHKGHGQIVEVKISIVNGISNIDSFQHISNELLIEYMKYSKEVIEIVNLLIPCEFQTIDSRSLFSLSHFAYWCNIYFIHSRDNSARSFSIRIVEDEPRIFEA